MNGNRLKKARKARGKRILRIRRLKPSIKSMDNILPEGENYNLSSDTTTTTTTTTTKNNIKKNRCTSSSSNKTVPCVSFSSSSAASDQDVGGSSSSSSSATSKSFRGDEQISSFLCSSHGSVSVCGRRREMEDAITVEPGFLSTDFVRYDFFAVYDGHGGSRVAQACRDRLHRVLAKEIEDEDQVIHNHSDHQEVINRKDHLVVDDVENFDDQVLDWEKIMYSCFSKMDDEITGNGIEEENGSGSMKTIGSTAVVAILGKEKLVVANCGDSRAVLSRGGTAIPLSRDHKPDRPDELERVEAAGGRVINWNGSRVLGVLATSRSIGDYYLKPYVISKPEVTVIERTINDEFLILASDGLWDVMSNETACQVVRKCLKGRMLRTLSMAVKGNNAGEAAAVLAELAMARGSKDNISVVVVELKKSSGYFF